LAPEKDLETLPVPPAALAYQSWCKSPEFWETGRQSTWLSSVHSSVPCFVSTWRYWRLSRTF